MYWFPTTEIPDTPLPEGYSISRFAPRKDIHAWCECLRGGNLIDGRSDGRAYGEEILDRPDIDPENDIFFLDYRGEHIGTATAFVHKSANIGDMHQVGIRADFRGKGLSKHLIRTVLTTLRGRGVRFVSLTTDEERVAAVKAYLDAGFCPVQFGLGMEDRWQAVLESFGIDGVPMYYEDGSFYKNIRRKGFARKVRIGVFGAGRGQSMMNFCAVAESAELVAVCDKRPDKLDEVRATYGKDREIACYSDFDEFLRHDMDCVVLANFANEHAPYAIRCLEAGKHVLSEVLPVQTMKEAVELVEAVERSGKIYFYAENYAYMAPTRGLRRLYREGRLGTFEYGEGEYLHNCEPIWHSISCADPLHWRNTMSAFYYCTHSLGPLIHITGQRPVRVTGFEAPFNERMRRMGAKAGPFGVEMVTLESGAILKSLHGVGPSRGSIWYTLYGSKGAAESARERAGWQGRGIVFASLDREEGDNDTAAEKLTMSDDLTERAYASGHGGADYYVMYNFVEAVRGNRNAEIIDVYEALDMFLPGFFAHLSSLDGGRPQEIPNLRDPAQRERWRNDVRCTDPKNPSNEILPSYSKGNPEIPESTYRRLREFPGPEMNRVGYEKLGRR